MDAQQIFDKVATHLLTQKTQAIEGPSCRYRTATGLTCAVGCLIPDQAYDPEMEGGSVYNLIARAEQGDFSEATREFVGEIEAHKELLADLQSLHDSESPAYWAKGLAYIAESHELTFNPPA
ncbi:hypothetical protein [Cupriavidus necator]